MKNYQKIKVLLGVFACLMTTAAVANEASVGVEFYVRDADGVPLTGDHEITELALCDTASGNHCYCQSEGTYTFDNGFLGADLNCSVDYSSLPATSFLRMTVLGVTVSSEVQAVPYALSALNAKTADRLKDGNITINGNLTVTGSVTGGSFPGVGGGGSSITSITTTNGLTGGGSSGDITLASVLGSTIDTNEIVDGTITALDISPDSIGSIQIQNGGVRGVDILDRTISTADVGVGAVTTTEIADGTIADTDINAAAAIAYSKLAFSDNIVAGDIATGAVTTAEILNGTISTVDLEDGSVNSFKIADGTIAAADVSNTLDFSNFADSMILDTNTRISSNNHDFTYHLTGVSDAFKIENPSSGSNALYVDSTSISARTESASTVLLSINDATTLLNLDNSQWTERLCHSGGDTSTGVNNIGDCNASGQADLAEHYGSDGFLSPGDVVVFDGPGFRYLDKSGKPTNKAYLTKSIHAYDDHVMGVISTNPFSEILGQGTFDDSENPVPLALTGRVPVNVTNQNGAIHAGDYLTTSDIPGFAMKATREGAVIGMALEDFNDDRGQTLMFIKTGQWSPVSVHSVEDILKGNVLIPQGQDFVEVRLPHKLDSVLSVSATPLSNPEAFFWVEKQSEGFRIRISKKSEKDLPFDWMVR